DLVEAIIALPSQLLINSSIPASIWLLNKNKNKNKEVLFVDASGLGNMLNKEQRVLSNNDINKVVSQFNNWKNSDPYKVTETGFSKSIRLEEIVENEYSLMPANYVGFVELNDIDFKNAVRLDVVLDPVMPSKIDKEVSYKKVSIKDLS